MNAFPIGTSAISVARRAIDVIGQNVANAATPGYSRQAVQLENRVTGSLGSGVDVASVTRFAAPAVRTAILAGNSDRAALDTRLQVRRQIEATFGAGTGGVGDALNGFFDQVEQLTGRPDNTAARRPLLTAASDTAARLQSSAGDIDRLRADLVNRAPQEVSALNDLAKKVADLNLRISIREQGGEQANDLRDQRDRFVNDISTKIDVRVVPQPFGVVNVIATGAPVVVGEFAGSFQVATDASNNLVVSDSGTGQPIAFTGGSLGALVREVNVEIPATRARLDAFAGELIRRTNALQATGLGLGGPIASTAGSVSLNSASAPLASAGVPFPLAAGALTVSVTDTATGTRTNTTLAIDPAAQSLNDIAAALSGVPGLTATVTAPSNSLTLAAQPGFAFDFAGRDTNPPGGGAVANTDTAGLLPALGLNGLFAGTGAANIAVRPELVADPNRFAAGRTGQPGDGTNLERFSALRDTPVLSGRTLAADFADQAAAVGSAVSGLDDQQTAQGNLMRALFAEEQSVAGVDENEEFVRLLDFQRMIQGASRYLSVVNSALDEVINIVK
jgi:flagellar hook-associated protein 1 FlgK